MGDALSANCTIEYKEDWSSDWTQSDIHSYTNISSLPDSFTNYVYGFDLGEIVNYRAACYYTTDGALSYTTYGTEKTVEFQEPIFDPFKGVLDNFSLVMTLIYIIGTVAGIASYGINNPIILLGIAVLLAFCALALGFLSLTTVVFLTLSCAVIGLLFLLMPGGKE